MTLNEARKAIENKTIVEAKDDSDNWMVLTCLPDNNDSTVYYKPKGMGLFSYSTNLNNLILPK